MKTSTKILTAVTAVVILALIAAVVALGIGLHGAGMRAAEAERRVDYMYETALCESLDSVRETENDIAKMLVSVDRKANIGLAADIRMNAGSAAARVATLPVDVYSYSGLEKFLNQVSDFMSGYIRAAESGADTEKYSEQFAALHETVSSVRRKLEEAADKLGGDYSLAADINESGSFDIGEGEFNVEYPSVIYDGPFSDSRDTSWKALEGKAEVSEEEAASVLAERLGMSDVRITGKMSGDAELYYAEGKREGVDATATVTVRGGEIVTFTAHGSEKRGGDIGQEKAQSLALGYAEAAGCDDSLVPVWYNTCDGDMLVTLAPEKGGILYYPDLVKVKLRADGSLAGIEAESYRANHRERELPAARMDKDAIRGCVSPRLSVEHIRLALIPDGSSERLCYEISSEYDGLDYFVYIDAVSGAQADILRVIDTYQGKQVI